MPLVKIEICEGRSSENLLLLQETVMDSVVKVLELPDNDRNIRLQQYKPGFFSMKPPYEILIEISLFKGRTTKTKKLLYQTIIENLRNLDIKKESVFILLNEQPLENWGVRGGIPASEIEFAFVIEK